MRFLVDACLSPQVAALLRDAGHDATHVVDLMALDSPDSVILARARDEQRVVVTADTDFGELLARTGRTVPSVVLFRRRGDRRPTEQASLLIANLDLVLEALTAGALVVLDEDRIRVRDLPIER